MNKSKVVDYINIDTYVQCHEFTVKELLNELKLRNWLAKSDLDDFVYHPQLENLIWTKDHFQDFWAQKIINRQPFAKAYGLNFGNAHLPFVKTVPTKKLVNLDESPALNVVTGQNIFDIFQLQQDIKRRIVKMDISDDKKSSSLQHILDSPVRSKQNSLIAAVDLSFSNSQLKEAFAIALDTWREELRISTSLSRKWNSAKFYNFLDYNVLLILDYLFLANSLREKKDLASLCSLIKGNDNYFEIFLSADFAFTRNVLLVQNIDILEQMIDTNPKLGDCLIKNVGSILK
jgi:hypothetical protein